MLLRTAIALGAFLALAPGCAVAIASDAPVNFARDVKPLLACCCFSCHGPNTQEGGLRLDNAEAALAELDSGLHAIVPSNVDESAPIARVTATDEAERMPPEGKPLTPSEVDTLKKWIAAGAKYEKHWGVRSARATCHTRRREQELDSQSDRRLHSGQARTERLRTCRACG